MTFEVIMPALGMAQDTGHLVGWQKSVGDAVGADDILMEVETDKSTMEVPAGADGYIAELKAQAGQDIPVGQVIAVISAEPVDAEALPEPLVEIETEKPPPAVQETQPEPAVQSKPATRPSETAADGRVLASPKARRLAEEAGLDLSGLQAAGVPQPYHVSDIEILRQMQPANGGETLNYGLVSSHISAAVPVAAYNEFIVRMREEGGIDLSLPDIIVSFAAISLRRIVTVETLTISLQSTGNERLVFSDPDKFRMSALEGHESDARSLLEIRDLGAGFLTGAIIAGANQITLSVSQNPQNLNLSLTFGDADLGVDQAIEFMHELTGRLADPLLALV
ncbi:Dihydrolipoyllysine-residue acetyltransferase component of pyruvate dehydrogenase complex [Roseibium album]|nr:Dihydrolipoyllysine-residue acetyltransferase component of pyruvate dehydrogenase complex [Roseibium album]